MDVVDVVTANFIGVNWPLDVEDGTANVFADIGDVTPLMILVDDGDGGAANDERRD